MLERPLDSVQFVVKNANMKAELLKQHRQRLPNGGLVEMKIWKLPCPVPPCDHAFKYRLVYILNGKRLVGFDNELGKGDHQHLDGIESVYRFVSIDQLLDDFIAEVERRIE
jgi:hypothetical protein